MVVIHDGVGSHDPQWFKTIIGGAWEYGHSKYFEGDIAFYYLDHSSPITRGASNFDFDDEMYWDLNLMPEAHVLAGTYQPDDRNKHEGRAMPSIYDVAPQMWTYEKDNYRAFVSIPGHNYKSFDLPHYRAVLLRGIAWAGKRDNVDLLVSKEELASLRYPEGGPTAPEEAVKKIVVPPDFNINLVASEPLIEKAISMDWDPKGRLWIAETPEYPFRKDRSRAPYDRISILEDTHGDGRMDKKTVFYEGLDLVTSMVLYRDGVIVSQAPYIIRLRDTKGKGKADVKEILYRGFGTNDTHAVVSNLRWGFDGWIYATIGYTRGDIWSGDGKIHFGKISDGVIRFQPDGSAMEQVSSKGGNTWGVDIAPDGEIFFSQANGNHIDHVVMPESALARGRAGNATSYLNIEDHNRSFPLMTWTKQAYVQIDWVGNFTAAAGACIYDGGAWPDKYNYTYYVAEPTINIVHQDFLKQKGVSYVASKDSERLEQEFIGSTDLWFRPIHQRVGPDGALYVLDFYNQAVVHNDTRGTRHDPQSNAAIRPDRDHYFGRIWRIQHKDAKKLDIPKLDHAKPAQLVKALEHPNEWVRMTALRLLLERNKPDVVPLLEKLAESEKALQPRAHSRTVGLGQPWRRGASQRTTAAGLRDCFNRSATQQRLRVANRRFRLDERFTSRILTRNFREARSSAAFERSETNARVRLEALIALADAWMWDSSSMGSAPSPNMPALSDPWQESAFLGSSGQSATRSNSSKPRLNSAKFRRFRQPLFRASPRKSPISRTAAVAAKIRHSRRIQARFRRRPQAGLARKPLARQWKARNRPRVVARTRQRPAPLCSTSPDSELAALTLPLAAHWDKSGALATAEINSLCPATLRQN